MPTIEEVKIISHYTDQLLEIVYSQDEFTTSDLQGAIEAIVMNILSEGKKMGDGE